MQQLKCKSICHLILIFLAIVGLFHPSHQSLNIHRAKKSHNKLLSLKEHASSDLKNSTCLRKENILTVTDKSIHNNHLRKNNSTLIAYSRNEAAVYAVLSAGMVGLSGILPLLILPSIDSNKELQDGAGGKRLQRLLSFAVGGLLGDVFLHLLPESWDYLVRMNSDGTQNHWPAVCNGLWTLLGLISFCLLEKVFPDHLIEPDKDDIAKMAEEEECCQPVMCNFSANGHIANSNNNHVYKKSLVNRLNGVVGNGVHSKKSVKKHETKKPSPPRIKTSGYLNLLANCIDNFTHGLAVGGSYLVSKRVGLLTTLAILLHEIPHEVSDFAILLRAGFTRWRAAKFQVLTAAGGLLGTAFAFFAESAKMAGDQVAWILPFTSGGFIYIALCTVVPEILQETSPRESIIQLFFMIFAIAIMHAVSFVG